MEDKKGDIAARKLRRRKVLRLGLILLAVIISLLIAAAYLLPASGQELQMDVPREELDAGVTQAQTESQEPEVQENPLKEYIPVLFGLLVLDVTAICWLSVNIRRMKQRMQTQAVPIEEVPVTTGEQIHIGQLHGIGAREYQEDSFGVSMLPDGVLAVVADGMGGLAGGDKISQKIVCTMLEMGDRLPKGQLDGALEHMVYSANDTVNDMLGMEGLYRSGSTALGVLVRQRQFHWISVGDSHIYLFRDGQLTQLNVEHNREQELMQMVQRGELSYEEVQNFPGRKGLTSFIGMGRLRYVDRSTERTLLQPGDRILLMTDGVFDTLSDTVLTSVLTEYPEVTEAAGEMERLIQEAANPRQDNFTAVILGL